MPQSQQNQPVSPRTCWQMRLVNLPNMCGSCIFTTCFQKHIDQFMYIYIDFMITSASHLVISRQKKVYWSLKHHLCTNNLFQGFSEFVMSKIPGITNFAGRMTHTLPPYNPLLLSGQITIPSLTLKSSQPARRPGPKTRWIIWKTIHFFFGAKC